LIPLDLRFPRRNLRHYNDIRTFGFTTRYDNIYTSALLKCFRVLVKIGRALLLGRATASLELVELRSTFLNTLPRGTDIGVQFSDRIFPRETSKRGFAAFTRNDAFFSSCSA
jgi:hypothetical protein